MVPDIVRCSLGPCSKVLLTAVVLATAMAGPALGQSADRSGNSAPANPAPAAAGQPFNVNPITGIASASAKTWRPLTGRERWHLYWRQNFASPGAYVGPVFTALVLDQATNSPREWGGGWPGFARRVGSRTAMAITQGTIQAGLAAALHEDVRYISSGEGPFGRRLLHAVKFSFLTYNSQGHTTLNIANISSIYATTAISTTWVPIQGNKAKYTLTNGTSQIALTVPINIVQEFWPDISRKFFHRSGSTP
jgi:hypothetical protein